mmetsp:Transcript_30002/g.54438  ORF Transcript_30002/g.54438 Transcript_30002/m.54438 type:complete len:211 (+) Transcript_30002:1474-2106(+)
MSFALLITPSITVPEGSEPVAQGLAALDSIILPTASATHIWIRLRVCSFWSRFSGSEESDSSDFCTLVRSEMREFWCMAFFVKKCSLAAACCKRPFIVFSRRLLWCTSFADVTSPNASPLPRPSRTWSDSFSTANTVPATSSFKVESNLLLMFFLPTLILESIGRISVTIFIINGVDVRLFSSGILSYRSLYLPTLHSSGKLSSASKTIR